MHTARFVVVAALAFAVPSALAQTLYKLIDKDGKVTYSEEKPKQFDGKVIPLTIDPNANTATLPKGNFGPAQDGVQRKKVDKKLTPEERIAQAQDRLDKAKAALKDAKDNPAPGDNMMVGKVGGGVRTIPSDDYTKKLEQLQQEVQDAEDNLSRVQKGG